MTEGAADNAVVLAGVVARAPQTRVSPAGIPITRFTLEHGSRQQEAGHERDARLRIAVVAAGEALSGRAAGLDPGTGVRVRGFLSRAGYRDPDTRLVLHARDIDIFRTPSPARDGAGSEPAR